MYTPTLTLSVASIHFLKLLEGLTRLKYITTLNFILFGQIEVKDELVNTLKKSTIGTLIHVIRPLLKEHVIDNHPLYVDFPLEVQS